MIVLVPASSAVQISAFSIGENYENWFTYGEIIVKIK